LELKYQEQEHAIQELKVKDQEIERKIQALEVKNQEQEREKIGMKSCIAYDC
jgi:hypothetical protein